MDDVLLQWQLTPGLQLQGQLRSRRSQYGDVRSAFGVESTAPGEHNSIEDRSARLGLAWRPSGQEVVLVSYVRQHEEESVLLPGRTRVLAIDADSPGHVLEAQYQRAVAGGHWLLGVARTRSTSQLRLRRYDPALPVPSGPCRTEAPCLTDDRQALNQDQAYAYWQQPLGDTLQGTLGLARLVADEPTGLRHLWLPKLGLLWRPTPEATVRAAAFRTLRRAAEFDQSIEPTSVVGFNQIYDDGNSVASVVHALGADVALSPGLKLSAAWTARRVSVPGPVTTSGQGTVDERWNEQQTRTELFWTPHPRIAVRGGLVLDRFWRHPLYQIPMLLNLRTASVPLAVRYFLNDGWFGEAAWTTVAQRVRTPAGMNMPEGFDRFRLVDLVLGRHAGASPTTVTLTVKNLFGQRFRFQDDSFRSGDVRLARYLPARSVVLAVQTVF
ncbi:TonB-dependent receptor [uncultured Aquincola sp.]|uniref:TonB-dependent receptor n=1 Tax=uncultured Aquincola sp. TaxID=886556 RepID=UPI0032B18AD6